MYKITESLTPSLDLIKNNLGKIILVIVSVVVFYLSYRITIASLKKLKAEIIPYYPFDKFFPKSGKWSVVYFLLTVLFLGALVYLIIKGNFYMAPA